MTYFYDGAGGNRRLRLSCSLLDSENIYIGLDRLAALINGILKQEVNHAFNYSLDVPWSQRRTKSDIGQIAYGRVSEMLRR